MHIVFLHSEYSISALTSLRHFHKIESDWGGRGGGELLYDRREKVFWGGVASFRGGGYQWNLCMYYFSGLPSGQLISIAHQFDARATSIYCIFDMFFDVNDSLKELNIL